MTIFDLCIFESQPIYRGWKETKFSLKAEKSGKNKFVVFAEQIRYQAYFAKIFHIKNFFINIFVVFSRNFLYWSVILLVMYETAEKGYFFLK